MMALAITVASDAQIQKRRTMTIRRLWTMEAAHTTASSNPLAVLEISMQIMWWEPPTCCCSCLRLAFHAATEVLSSNRQNKKRPEIPGVFNTQRVTASTAISRFAFIATDLAAHQILTGHCFKRSFSFVLIRHFNKSKTATPSGLTVMDNFRAFDNTMCFKRFPQSNVIDAPCKISNKNIHDNTKCGANVGGSALD
jgi:hypothetical protein